MVELLKQKNLPFMEKDSWANIYNVFITLSSLHPIIAWKIS